jgi:hypothetical protein
LSVIISICRWQPSKLATAKQRAGLEEFSLTSYSIMVVKYHKLMKKGGPLLNPRRWNGLTLGHLRIIYECIDAIADHDPQDCTEVPEWLVEKGLQY